MMVPNTTKSSSALHHIKKHNAFAYQTLIFNLVLYNKFSGLMKPTTGASSRLPWSDSAACGLHLRQLVTNERHMF